MRVAADRVRARPGSHGSPGREVAALLIYFGFVAALLASSAAMLLAIADQRAALRDSRDTVARLARSLRAAPSGDAAGPGGETQPFLAGATVTIAGAGLQARVEAAAKKAGAKILSSRIDLQGPDAAEGFVGLSGNLEIQQANLQALLYDLETGMPYLFIESLEVQSPQSFGEGEEGRMRVEIGVSGQWRDTP